jgi:hypothetical protein
MHFRCTSIASGLVKFGRSPVTEERQSYVNLSIPELVAPNGSAEQLSEKVRHTVDTPPFPNICSEGAKTRMGVDYGI